jgi:hypothetical protein
VAAPQLDEITHVIQLSVAPVFLLAGVGAIINALAGRLGRIIDRARVLELRLPDTEARDDQAAIHDELKLLTVRARWVNIALTLAVVCALLVTLTISIAFLGAFISATVSGGVAITFVGAMCAFSAALLAFLREIFLADRTLRFGIERAEGRHLR